VDNLYNKESIVKKIEKLYKKGEVYRYFLGAPSPFPYAIKLKSPTQKQIQEHFTTINQRIETLRSMPFRLEYKQINFKNIGSQKLPTAIIVEDAPSLFRFLKKEKEALAFRAISKMILLDFPDLEPLLLQKPFLVLEYDQEEWAKVLRVVSFLMEHPTSALYIRQINIEGVHTKFIESHKKIVDLLVSTLRGEEPLRRVSEFAFERRYGLRYELAMVRFRILDPALAIEGLMDLAIDVETFSKLDISCERVFIVENLTTFLAFPPKKSSILVFGGGYGVQSLKNASWLHNKKLYYWGDIDYDGYAILSSLRSHFSHATSFLMEREVIKSYGTFGVRLQKKMPKKRLEFLNEEEREAYESIEGDFRLEQEFIPYDVVKKRVEELA